MVVLNSTIISKIVLEHPPRFVDPPVIRFLISDHPPFMCTLQMFGPECERVC